MYKHTICINPLNAGMSAGINAFSTFDESEYSSATDRKILFEDPYKSFFKMKSVTITPYLEPAFFGLKLGDYFDVEFELMKTEGNPNFTVQLGKIGPAGNNAILDVHTISPSNLSTYFKKFKMRVPIRSNFPSDSLGVFFNLRTTTNGSEITLKNVKIDLHTNNSSFKSSQDLIVYNHKNDFLRVIETFSKTDVRDYSTIKVAYENGEITLPNPNTFKVTSSVAGTFKGLIAKPNGNYYGNSIGLFIEYKTNSGNNIRATLKQIRNDGTTIDGANHNFTDSAGEYVKKLVYLPINAISDNFRGKDNILEIGWLGACDFEIKKIIVSNHQYDDFIDVHRCGVNSLESWFINLSNAFTS